MSHEVHLLMSTYFREFVSQRVVPSCSWFLTKVCLLRCSSIIEYDPRKVCPRSFKGFVSPHMVCFSQEVRLSS